MNIERSNTNKAGALRAGIVITGVGSILLLLGEKSRAEKNGYNF